METDQQLLQSLFRAIGRARVYDVAHRTPMMLAEGLSSKLDHQVYLKREDLQRTHSFKIRGAYNRIAHLELGTPGVIAASAGNHAQGVALGAREHGLPATIVMPRTTPRIKVAGVERYGPHIVLHGDNFDQAKDHAARLAEENGLTMIHPFDDFDVIAGQGTVGKEILDEEPDMDAVFIPVGGGGLLAGVAAWIKQLNPECRIIAVEAEESACLKAALDAGKPVELETVDSFADGVAVRKIGRLPFDVAAGLVDEVITVDPDAICAAIKDVFENTRSIAEPAGALAIAGLKQWVSKAPDRNMKLVALLSGANIDFHNLRHISERAETGEHREALFAVTIPEVPGAFLKLCESLGKRNVTEFNYRYADPKNAVIFIGVHTPGGLADRHTVARQLGDAGFEVLDLSDNETAKLHLRHLVGGKSQAENEKLFRFEFPERPGALLSFLKTLGSQWNISLFHYRNHGAAMGRVLVGFQIPGAEYPSFIEALENTHYPWWDESENPACELFLR